MDPVIDPAVLWGFALLWSAIVPTPGANSLLITHIALNHGKRQVAMAIVGNMLGITLLAGLALLGMAALLALFPWGRLTLHILGGGYLAYFGVRLLTRALRPEAVSRMVTQSAPPTDGSCILLGFATQLSNAQAIVFITSIFAVTGVLDASLATGLACVATMIAMNATWLSLLGALFQIPALRDVYRRVRRWFEGVIGILFIYFGIRLIAREVATVMR